MEKRKKDFKNILNTLKCGMVLSILHYNVVTGQRAADVRLFVFYLSLGQVWVCEIQISHMGKHNGNYDLVSEKIISFLSQKPELDVLIIVGSLTR